MPTQFIATAAAAFLFIVNFAEPVAAQYHHDHGFHHRGVYGRAHDYHHGFDYHSGHYQDYGNAYLTDTSVDPPISDGMLLVFPSYLMHSGLPYQGDQDRIVISVNTRTSLAN